MGSIGQHGNQTDIAILLILLSNIQQDIRAQQIEAARHATQEEVIAKLQCFDDGFMDVRLQAQVLKMVLVQQGEREFFRAVAAEASGAESVGVHNLIAPSRL